MSKDINDNLDRFTKMIQDSKQIGDKNIDEYTTIVLLNAIHDSYNDVKSAITYVKDHVTLDTLLIVQKQEIRFNK